MFPYSFEPGADSSVQAVSLHPVVGCHYFPPGLRLPSQLQSITTPWPVPSLYCLVTEAHKCEQLAQGCYAALP